MAIIYIKVVVKVVVNEEKERDIGPLIAICFVKDKEQVDVTQNLVRFLVVTCFKRVRVGR